jgi:histidinol-phosphate phosphatase family protein
VSLRSAAFLDRDGTLNATVVDPTSGQHESPLRVADVRLLSGAVAGARKLAQAGYALVCVSNQPAAAKGRTSVQELLAVHERVVELLACEGVRLDASRLCLHHPQGVLAGLAGECDCRKPAPGMLLDLAHELGFELTSSWMLGDSDTDVVAGAAAGCKTVLIEYPGSSHRRRGRTRPDLLAVDLTDAAVQLVEQRTR